VVAEYDPLITYSIIFHVCFVCMPISYVLCDKKCLINKLSRCDEVRNLISIVNHNSYWKRSSVLSNLLNSGRADNWPTYCPKFGIIQSTVL